MPAVSTPPAQSSARAGVPSAESTAAPGEREIDVRLARVADERYEQVFGEQRSVSGTAGLVALITLLALAGLFPPAQRFLGVPFRWLAPLLALDALPSIAAAVAFRFGGALGRPHVLVERLEQVVIPVCGAALVYLSGGVGSVFWVWLAGAVFMGSQLPFGPAVRWAVTWVAVSYGGLGVAFALTGRPGDGFVALFLGLSGAYMWVVLARAELRKLRAQAEAELLRERLEQVLVEQERSRIARDLHDGLGAELTALLLQARALDAQLAAPEQRARVAGVTSRIGRTLDELRAAVWSLRPASHRFDELVVHVTGKCRDLCDGRLELEVDSEGPPAAELPATVQGALVLMAQEAVRNAATHARARTVRVRLALEAGRVQLEVCDDGAGLPPGAVERSTGGLRHLQERVLSLNGTAEFSRQPTGTRVLVSLPAVAEPAPAEASPARG